MSTVMLITHCRNYMAYQTTNERLSKRGQASKIKDSVVTVDSEMIESTLMTFVNVVEGVKPDANQNRKKGCCINMWKMMTRVKIMPQDRLYNYLAERDPELSDDKITFE